MRKVFCIILVALISSGCADTLDKIVNPVPWGMETMPEGTATFQKGWGDGCQSGITTYGNDRYKVAYGWKQDAKMVLNDEYYRAWKDAYVYCRWYAYNWVRESRE